MEPRSLKSIAQATGGRLIQGQPDAVVQSVCTDSRILAEGALFVALTGVRFDGHTFLAEVERAGAAAVLVEEERLQDAPLHCGIITVDNTRSALGRLAAAYRQAFSLPVIAVAGSNGKTSTKDLIKAALQPRFPTLASPASFNNDIGVPLTLLQLENTHQAAVLEAGTNHPGELLPLLRLIQPLHGVLTDVGEEHLEFFQSVEGVAEEEGGLAECLPPQGVLFTNGDNRWMHLIENRLPSETRLVKAGLGDHNDWRASRIHLTPEGMRFRVDAPNPEFRGLCQIKLLGRHQVRNALLALAVACELGVPAEAARQGLESCAPAPMRLQLWQTRGVHILDDAYNANVDSMKTALETLRDLPCSGRRLAVLGDMAELGDQSKSSHQRVGELAAALGVQALIVVGNWGSDTAQSARQAGLQEIYEFNRVPEAALFLKRLMQPGDIVLLKASRSSVFERVGDLLRQSD